jgi:hypothetical protein
MRAQFATIEALISLLAILSVISFVSGEIFLNTRGVCAARSRAIQSMAAYDAAEQIAGNWSTNECVASAHAAGASPCLATLLESYREAFGIRHFELAFQGFSVGNATANDTPECLPIRFVSLNVTDEVCIIAGD